MGLLKLNHAELGALFVVDEPFLFDGEDGVCCLVDGWVFPWLPGDVFWDEVQKGVDALAHLDQAVLEH